MRLRARNYAILLLLGLALFLPGLAAIPPVDRDEPRFAEASRQMIESGDYVNIRFQDEARLKKPIGIYWLQAASAAIFAKPSDDGRIWPYRLPSLLGALGAVLLTAAIGARLFGPAAGFAAGLLMAVSLLLGIEARLAKTDAVQLATVCLAQFFLARTYLERDQAPPPGRAGPVWFWLAIGLGIIIKGPIILMVCGLTALTLSIAARDTGWLRRLRPWPYVLLTILVVLPWIATIFAGSPSQFWREAFEHDLIGKVASTQESHGMFPGFFAVSFWATFWPGSLLAGLAIPWVWRHRHEAEVRFCLAWLVPSWIVFEIVPTKLPHYTLPLFPAIAILAARAALDPLPAFTTLLGRNYRRILMVGWLVITAGLCAGPPYLMRALEKRVDIASGLLFALALLLFGLALYRFRGGVRAQAAALLAGACLIYSTAAYQWLGPELTTLWVSPRIAAAVTAAKRCSTPDLVSAGFSEPSLVFAVGAQTKFGNGDDAAQALIDDPCALALIDRPFLDAFNNRLKRAGIAAEAIATIKGINIARGKRVSLTLFAPPAAKHPASGAVETRP